MANEPTTPAPRAEAVPKTDDALAQSIATLARFYIGESTLGEALTRVCELTAVAVPPAAYTGISMLVEDKVTTSVFSDPDVPEIDQAQYEAGNGPCLDSFRDACVYGVPSTRADDRWPEFSQAALAHGIGSTLSLPLLVGSSAVGALNLYCEQEHGFDEAHQQAAELFAAQAAVMLANSQLFWDAHALSEQLTEALASRATIEQAKGILVAQSGVDPESAFELLRRASQRENRKLRDIAVDLVQANVKVPG